MHVSVEKTSELSRKMTVSIPEDVIQEKIDARLKSLKSEIKIDGFRPGKIPLSLIKKRYGSRIRGEVSGDIIQSSYYEALRQEKLIPVDMPHVHPVKQPEGLAYTAEFEVYPVISLAGFTEIEAKRPIASIKETDYDDMLQRLREHKIIWHTVEREAQEKDRVTCNFSGICNDKNFTDGQVEDFKLEIGKIEEIPGFGQALQGLKAGDSKNFDLTFPKEYPVNPDLAAQLAHFEVNIDTIEEPQLPEIDVNFIQEYGIDSGDMDTFHTDVKANMENELKKALANELKISVLFAVYEHANITLPQTLVDREIENIMKPYLKLAQQKNKDPKELNITKELFKTEAKRRVGLGLLLNEIVQKNNFVIDHKNLQRHIEAMAKTYDDPDEMIAWYYEDEQRLDTIKQSLLEAQVVEWLSEQITLIDEPLTFFEVMEQYHLSSPEQGQHVSI